MRAALEEAGHKGAIGEGEREEGREVEVEVEEEKEDEDTVKGACRGRQEEGEAVQREGKDRHDGNREQAAGKWTEDGRKESVIQL